jgi:hypothetical protein
MQLTIRDGKESLRRVDASGLFVFVPRKDSAFFSKAFLSFFHITGSPKAAPNKALRPRANCQHFSALLEVKQPKMCDGKR